MPRDAQDRCAFSRITNTCCHIRKPPILRGLSQHTVMSCFWVSHESLGAPPSWLPGPSGSHAQDTCPQITSAPSPGAGSSHMPTEYLPGKRETQGAQEFSGSPLMLTSPQKGCSHPSRYPLSCLRPKAPRSLPTTHRLKLYHTSCGNTVNSCPVLTNTEAGIGKPGNLR